MCLLSQRDLSLSQEAIACGLGEEQRQTDPDDCSKQEGIQSNCRSQSHFIASHSLAVTPSDVILACRCHIYLALALFVAPSIIDSKVYVEAGGFSGNALYGQLSVMLSDNTKAY